MSKIQLKFIGSLVLLVSTAGVLLAIGGQLNFLGNKRPEQAPVVKAQDSGEKAKYSFYDELKRRKTEVDRVPRIVGSETQVSGYGSRSGDITNPRIRYMIQVGAFSYVKDANLIKARVRALGYPVQINKSHKYLVQVGPFIGKEKTYRIEGLLKDKGFPTLVRRLK